MKSTVLRIVLLALALGMGGTAAADHRHNEMRYDGRYNHGRSYPSHGYVYGSLPRGYVNVHTPKNPGGEIRGQIRPVPLTVS